MFWNKGLLLGFISASVEATINYQKLGNCGVPRVKANVNIFDQAQKNVNSLHRRRRAAFGGGFTLDEFMNNGFDAPEDDADVVYDAAEDTPEENNQTQDASVEEAPAEQQSSQPVGSLNSQGTATMRIVGGQTAASNSWPWQAHLSVCGKWYGVLECNICGGSVISPKWIVSAAHCVPDDPSGTIILGAHQISQGGTQRVPVKKFIKHTSWNKPKMFDNDLSLLELTELARMSSEVSPICISHSGTCFAPQTPCVVTGWGLTSETGGFPDDLQEVAVRLITEKKCKTFQGYAPTITENMLCAGFDGGAMDACAGDSGGPLVCPLPAGGWVLYGVVSWGYGCARPNSPGVYTRMTNMGAFIKEITGLEADPALDMSDKCGEWHENFEEDFKDKYEKAYSNKTHVWGVNLNDIEWSNSNFQQEQEDQSSLVTDQCNYLTTNDYGKMTFDSAHFEEIKEFIIHSENFPKSYPANQDCSWTIKNTNPERFISVTIPKGIRFDCKDRLYINRENGKPINICRTKKSITLLDPSKITLRFTTNQVRSGSGFQALVSFKKLTFMCTGNDRILLRKASGSGGRSKSQQVLIKSENYPRPYSAYSQCRWHVRAEVDNTIGFFIKAFKTEKSNGRCSSQHDNLLVFEADNCETDTLRSAPVWGSICGVKPNNRLRYNTGLTSLCITFLADGDSRRGKGFLLQINQINSNNQVVPSFQEEDL